MSFFIIFFNLCDGGCPSVHKFSIVEEIIVMYETLERRSPLVVRKFIIGSALYFNTVGGVCWKVPGEQHMQTEGGDANTQDFPNVGLRK